MKTLTTITEFKKLITEKQYAMILLVTSQMNCEIFNSLSIQDLVDISKSC